MTEQTIVYPKCTKCGKLLTQIIQYLDLKPYCIKCYLEVFKK